MTQKSLYIDSLQYANWDKNIFKQMQKGGLSAVHVAIAYHENFREMVANIEKWKDLFQEHEDLIFHGRTGEDVIKAQQTGKTAIIFGFQNPSPIEDDIRLVEICHDLGVRFMQLTYNNQSLLATGCYEATDTGITRMGKQVIAEMNRVGLVVDMSHSAERSTLEAIECSNRPIAITHANPYFWHPALRNKSEDVLKALAESGGMLGCSIYPHHLKDGGKCTLDSFCTMISKTADLIGVDHIGIGSDLCQGHPESVVTWMRNGRWSKETDYGEGSASNPSWPKMPTWFEHNADFPNIEAGLLKVGFSKDDSAKIMGGNWLRFFKESFNSIKK